MIQSNTKPATEPVQDSTNSRTEPQKPQLRRNPRIVIGNLDFFEMIMEQDEEG